MLRFHQLNYSNPYVSNAPSLYPLKTPENLGVFWCFQGVEKGCSGNKWINCILELLQKSHIFVLNEIIAWGSNDESNETESDKKIIQCLRTIKNDLSTRKQKIWIKTYFTIIKNKYTFFCKLCVFLSELQHDHDFSNVSLKSSSQYA